MRLRALFVAVLVSALSVAATVTVASAAPPAGSTTPRPAATDWGAWDDPVLVGAGDYSHVAVAIGPNGRLHAAAAGNSGIWYLRELADGSFKRQRISTNLPDGHDDYPSIDVDDSNRPHVAFVRWACDECAPNPPEGIFYSRRSGGSWSGLRKLAGVSTVSPSLKIHAGHIYLAYARCECIPKQTEQVWFLTDLGPSGGLTRVKVDEGGGNPSLQVTPGGKPRIAFDGHGLWYARGGTSTGGFTKQQINPDAHGDAFPALVLTSGGQPIVAWSRGGSASIRGLFVSRRSGGAFVSQRLDSVRSRAAIALNPDDTVVVGVWRPSEGVWIYDSSGAGFTSTVIDDEAVADGIGVVVDPVTGVGHVMYSATGGVPVGIYAADRT